MSTDLRHVDLVRTASTVFTATNERGGTFTMTTASGPEFTPGEALLAAIAACGAIDLDLITSRRAEPDSFAARTTARSIRDELGNRFVDIQVTFDVRFPDGEDGDAARQVLPRTLEQIRDRLCTVSRTVAVGAPVEIVAGDLS
jgi:putative redox protein